MPDKYRVGRQLGTTIYRIHQEHAPFSSEPIAWVPGDPELAAFIVRLLNGQAASLQPDQSARRCKQTERIVMPDPTDSELREACAWIENDGLAWEAWPEIALIARALPAKLDRIAELETQLRVAREALVWYASERTWHQWLPDSAGDRARTALTALSPQKEMATQEGMS